MPSAENGTTCFEQYWRYASALKNWFIGYGIGMLYLFVNSPTFFANICRETRITIFIFVIVAISAQVLEALINKITQYYVYRYEIDEESESRWYHDLSGRIAGWFWIDLICDITTIFAYCMATYLILSDV